MLLFTCVLNVVFQVKLAIAEPAGIYISVPYHRQITNYYCGPASLEMIFDFYGPDISQVEIADVARTSFMYGGTYTDDMRRAVHFSNLSSSVGEEFGGSITGYSGRGLGYAAFEHWGFSLDELETLIDAGYPITVLTWFTESHTSGHFRVVVGYNETHVTLQDPWFGPMRNMTNSKFLDLWEYSYYWGLFTSPWNVNIVAPEIVEKGNTFTVTATVTYPCPTPFSTYDYPASLTNATLILPVGLSLAQGEIAKKAINTADLAAGSSATVTWAVEADSLGVHTISVEAEGKVAGFVFPLGHYPEYSYEDRIGGSSSFGVTVKPAGASAELVRRNAWPEHHHFVLSKDGDPAIDDRHGTPGCQTLYGMVKNTGNVTIPAEMYKVVWTITDSIGSVHTLEAVGTVDLLPGDVRVLTYDLPAADLIPGKYSVEAQCYYYWIAGRNVKTFHFIVVP